MAKNTQEDNNAKENIRHFVRMVAFYKEVLGIFDWEIYVDEGTSKNDRAWILSDLEGRLSTIFFSKVWITDFDTTLDEVDRVAFHEVCEASLAEIRLMMLEFYAEKIVNSLIHSMVRRMENVLWPLLSGKKNLDYSGLVSKRLKMLMEEELC